MQEPSTPPTNYFGSLYKTWGEFFDHAVTRNDTITADIYVYPDPNQSENVTICGLIRNITSTKEFADVEAEIYAGLFTGILSKF